MKVLLRKADGSEAVLTEKTYVCKCGRDVIVEPMETAVKCNCGIIWVLDPHCDHWSDHWPTAGTLGFLADARICTFP